MATKIYGQSESRQTTSTSIPAAVKMVRSPSRSDAGPTRTLPAALRSPESDRDYSTGSPYKLRADFTVQPAPENSISTIQAELVDSQAQNATIQHNQVQGAPTTPALQSPKVSRVPVRRSIAEPAPTASQSLPQPLSQPQRVSSLPPLPVHGDTGESGEDTGMGISSDPPSIQQSLPLVEKMTSEAGSSEAGSAPPFAAPKLQSNLRPSSAQSDTRRGPPKVAERRLAVQAPNVHVALRGPNVVEVGSAQQYFLEVVNESQMQVPGLIVRLDVPRGVQLQPPTNHQNRITAEQLADGATLVTCMFDTMGPGEQVAVPLQIAAQTGIDFSVGLEWTFQPLEGRTPIEVISPALELQLQGPGEVNYAEANTYRLQVLNRGTADAHDVVVTLAAQEFGSSSLDVGTVTAGGSEAIDVELVFKQPGKMNITADARARGGLATRTETGVHVRQSRLDIQLDAPELAYYGSASTYEVRLSNHGDAVARAVCTRIHLPSDARLLNAPPDLVNQSGILVWNLDQLSPGGSQEIQFQVALAREGDNHVTADCSTSTGSAVRSDAVTQVKAVTDLKLMVSDPSGPASVGSEVVYELALANRGSKTVQQVLVAGLFSNDIEPVRAEGHRHQLMPGQVRFEPIVQIKPGETVTLKIIALASAPGMHRFRAEVKTDDAGVQLVQEETTQFLEAIRRTARSADVVPLVR
ncbi:MAG: hypothetical protein KF752_20545 [Pirellulaceae bacterium]|nr:hypothetical protein [Pirellulaceae bacterium]